MVTQFEGLRDTYVAANDAVTEAFEMGVRSKPLTAARKSARDALLQYGRHLYKVVQGFPGLTPQQLAGLGVHVIDVEPTPIPPPATAPLLNVLLVMGNIVRIKLSNAAEQASRARPAGTIGATVVSHVGENPPAQLNQWKLEGSIGRNITDVVFDANLAPGTKVWISAYWFNNRKEAGPMAPAISANIGGGAIQQAA